MLAATLFFCGCGALDDSAPPAEPPKHCRTVDEYLAPLQAHVAAGRLVHVGRIVQEDLDRPTLRAVVRLVIDVVRALPPATFASLTATLGSPQAGGTLVPIVIALLEPLPGDPTAQPPVPPRNVELTIFSHVATTCLTADLYVWLTELLRDARLRPIVGELLATAGELGADLEAALAAGGVKGRDAIVALLRNVAVSISRPDFDPLPLIAMVDGLAAQSASLKSVSALLRVAMLDEAGAADPVQIAALSAFVGCFVDLDAGFVLPGYWYDVFASGALSAAFAATPTGDEQRQASLDATMAVLTVLSYATGVLAASSPARDALGQVGALILRPDLAVEAIPEVLDLLRSDALDSLPAMLADIANQPCLAAAPG